MNGRGGINTDRILSAGNQALYTESVQIIQPTKRRRHSKQQLSDATRRRILRVVTCSTLHDAETAIVTGDGGSSHIQINVQPLMVLDLNGILCHRVRRQHQADPTIPSRAEYRSQLGPDIAQTPIIPRPNLSSFLEFLDQHFCLAIWTSAKQKTARKLVELLIPQSIKNRLLFVWSQGQCQVDTVQDSKDGVTVTEKLYRKDLGLVWLKFPLWNRYNTLLMDDSPDKCVQWKENALHPQPLHGRRIQKQYMDDNDMTPSQHQFTEESTIGDCSDENNVLKQLEFMKFLVQYWNSYPVTHTWDSECDNDAPPVVTYDGDGMTSFLAINATGYMGWKI
jgi:NLI interacting factor-like phosphatase